MFTILLVILGTLSHMTLNDFIGSLRTLRIPSSILGSMLIMFRYIPLFMEERGRMQEAQKLRGYEKGGRLDRIRSLGNLVGTTIDRSFDRSTRVYDAMSLRGFGRGMMIRGTGFRRTDAILPLLILTLLAILPYIASLISEVLLL
jgi:cobalt/nickel transport system permease protein